MFVPRRRRIGGGGAAVDLVPASVNFVSGDAHATAPDTIDLHYPNAGSPNAPANFAFWSIIGSSDGEYTSRPGTPGNPVTVHTDGDPVTMTAWYIFAGGGGGGNGNGRHELETDAFLVDQNQFVEPTPIASVAPPAAWDPTDVQEFVFTDDQSCQVTARDSVVDATEHFETWYALEGAAMPAGDVLDVPQGDNGIAVATYRIPPHVPFKPPRSGEGIVGTIVGGVARDGSGGIIVNGHFHPIGPWDPFLAALSVYESAKGLRAADRTRIQVEAMTAIANTAKQVQKEVEAAAHEG
jgi:hypothetical protein